MWHINDLYGVNAAHPAELLSVIALDDLDRIAARAKRLLGHEPSDAGCVSGIAQRSGILRAGIRQHHLSQTVARQRG